MTQDQTLLFAILAILFALLIWGRWRYDLVAFLALLASVLVGVVSFDNAFSGFGHPATIIIAFVIVISRGLTNSGVIELVASKVIDTSRTLSLHISVMAGFSAALSAVMNNIAALALLMPIDLKAAQKAKRSPGLSLMPLAFASILGGMLTLIGTPPNIIIAAYREKTAGEPFGMFDFSPVGGLAALTGVLFVALIGWRLIPKARGEADASAELHGLEDYISELRVSEKSEAIGKTAGDFDDLTDEHDIQILGIIRNGQRLPGIARRAPIREDDLLVVEGGPEGIEAFLGALALEYVTYDDTEDKKRPARDLELREVVVPPGSFVDGRMVKSLDVLRRQGVSILGISRQGQRFRQRIAHVQINAGDILLLLGSDNSLTETTANLGTLPLAERGLQIVQRKMAGLSVGIFGAAIFAATFGLIQLPIALGLVVAAYVLFGIVPIREVYRSIEWSIIVLLGSLIPIGAALETSGGSALLAGALLTLTEGYAPWIALTLLMIMTMTISDIMNNTATAVMAAPVAVEVADRLGVNSDPFLMAVAVAASCAFLTPIGHNNNTLIMGPGGYSFGDYWRMGLPLEILIVAVSVPALLWFWPL
ncbi:SLC13 family permease [Sneathiella chinensis]|uniref:SLC13 family permease n=1 Tax=Sneathiella chinensis TaxID=349750 RepID=A0ABQ5U178_9PROT|nr:SLC13 family permease [Sneathiella chinensis]GLQ05925.1 SLC13 family permease [Sneathiella chinensis]